MTGYRVSRRRFVSSATCATFAAATGVPTLRSARSAENVFGQIPVEAVNNNELTLCVDRDIWDADKLKMASDGNSWAKSADKQLAYAELGQAEFQSFLQEIEAAASAIRPENQLLVPDDIAAAVPAMMAGDEGDAVPNAVVRAEGAIDSNKKWARGQTLTVSFLNVVSQRIKNRIESNVRDAWEDACSIRFKFVPSSSADIRITVFTGGGSWSYIGTDARTIAKGKQTMHFGWLSDDLNEDKFRSVVLHEFGHSLGFIHEHQHPEANTKIKWNRPAVINYYSGPPNKWSIKKVEQNVLNRYSGAQIKDEDRTAFDERSIMLYPTSAKHTLDGYSTGWNTRLSDSDRQLARGVYGGGSGTIPKEPSTKSVRRADLPEGAGGLIGQEIKTPGDAILFRFPAATSGKYRFETFEGEPAIAMKLSAYRDEGMRDRLGEFGHHNGKRLLNARVDAELESGKTYYVLAEHFFKTRSSVGKFNIRATKQ